MLPIDAVCLFNVIEYIFEKNMIKNEMLIKNNEMRLPKSTSIKFRVHGAMIDIIKKGIS